MIKIRRNVFETNSSSTHSLAYLSGNILSEHTEEARDYEIELFKFYNDDPENGILAINFGDYGWSGDPCSDFRHKLSYLLTQIVGGYGLTYYGNCYDDNDNEIPGEKPIEIKTQKQWDEVIDKYVLTNPKITHILDFIKTKCPNIKGFKFYWYDVHRKWDLEDSYTSFKDYYDIKDDLKMPEFDLSNKFYSNNYEDKFIIGLGYCDHQSCGLLSELTDQELDKYLFDENVWVIITNDNR